MGLAFYTTILLILSWGPQEIPNGMRIAMSVIGIVIPVMIGLPFQYATEFLDKTPRIQLSMRSKAAIAGICIIGSAVAAGSTYGNPQMPILGPLASLTIRAGEAIFPVIRGYKTEMSISPEELFRIQGFMSAFLVSGLLVCAYVLLRMITMSKQRRFETRKVALENLADQDRLAGHGAAAAGLLMALASAAWILSASGEFADTVLSTSAKGCALKAKCYIRQNDAELILTALLKLGLLYTGPFALLVLAFIAPWKYNVAD